MPYAIDDTHDPKLESWVESANDPDTDFPIQNLPLAHGIIKVEAPPEMGEVEEPEFLMEAAFIRIGDQFLNLAMAATLDLLPLPQAGPDLMKQWYEFSGDPLDLCDIEQPGSHSILSQLRQVVQLLLSKENPNWKDLRDAPGLFVSEDEIELLIPTMNLGDYTDFYASKFHATNVGSMFRPDNPLLPNYKWIPVGYHGRASSIVPSGTSIVRPNGQTIEGNMGPESVPSFGPCKLLDYELEMGAIIARGNELGTPVSMAEAEDHMLGLCILNDWSARDMQKWEYQPLGPFLAKNFASTVSPYIVTMEALAPFRTPAMDRTDGDPDPMPHLDSPANRESGGFDIKLEVFLSSQQMREKGMDPKRISRGNFKDMYWTVAQMIAHHTSNGCNLQPGDLLGSGTISGPTRESRGCLLELTWDGDPFANPPKIVPGTQRTPIELPTGEGRKFLADGDEIIIRAFCERDGFRRIGFGECRGVIHPSHEAR
jgi:fumarylacetoacetase